MPLRLDDDGLSATPADVHRLGRAILGLASAGIFLAHAIDAYQLESTKTPRPYWQQIGGLILTCHCVFI
jgi:hypothetical protein